MSDLIDRQAAIDAIQQHREDVLGGYKYDEGVAFVYAAAHNHIIDVIKHLPSTQPEYTENEEKVLVTMFTIIKNILDLQGGYMDIDYTSFGNKELFYLSQKLGIDY